ncbi:MULTISPECIES: Arm DNA-binding domain-containing protein [Bacillus]|uniref:Arm DNA-binding domain-containing protein n=1 Tax=Bacillus TaxID=1386 RepID=UPI0001976172|nr:MULTISPECIES: Arm DNA-binding domain-containing protein [Bacillales]AOL32392.1 hypothetical protein BGM20_18150 [Alkalicoccobacillus gibsonii]AIY91892.1 hypothetical protein QU35_03485 [Bacillus subtilis subsp. subtilis str. 168]AIY96202.1 hypothetical protein QX56_03480 [Bacillus subtilis]AJE93269.1 hypothetical protein RP72_03365 [Bacillus subtilis subsp. subtilis]AKC46143.1 hypothetical protein O7A_03480 [Bacillus subtilis KCTC 1028 = ATCC 6051a]
MELSYLLGIDPLTKKRLEISKGRFKTKKEAPVAARHVELQNDNGTFIKESDMPFKTFAKGWLKIYNRSGVKISSVRASEKKMMHFIAVLGQYPISKTQKNV